jgi:hypothetical protein
MGSVLEVKSHHVAIVQVLANNNYKLQQQQQQQQQQFLLELSTPSALSFTYCLFEVSCLLQATGS